MDDFITHVGHLPRLFPSPLRVGTMGYFRHKKAWMRHRFTTFNFSFILSGAGEYRREGDCWPVKAPCVITQDPGTRLEYGPSKNGAGWEELYITYFLETIPALERSGLIRSDKPAWYVQDPGPTRARITELKALLENVQSPGHTDRIDRVCEAMILEAILGEARHAVEPEERTIQEIRDYVCARFRERHDFDALALKHGLSPATFRRHWQTHVGVPPVRYVMRLRIREACRLLVETRSKIGEIAMDLGFDDPLYFSRRFRLETGVTAGAYRRHQSPLSLASIAPGSAKG